MKKIFGFLIFFVVLIISNSEFSNSSSSSSCGCIAVPTFNSTGTNLSKASDTCANESLAVLVANLPSVVCGCLLPSSSATASGSASPSATASASKEATISANPTETSIATLSATRSSRPSLSATTSRSFTSSSTSTKSSRPSPSGTATSSESGKATDTRTSTPSPSPTPTPTPTQTPTPSPSPTPSKTPSSTPSNLPPSATSSISESPTKTPSPTPTPSVTPSPSTTPSITSSATSTESGYATVSSLPTNSATITASVSASASPSSSSSSTASSTAFDSATATFSSHASISAISSLTATRSAEPTSSSSSTKSSLPSSSAISTFTATASVTPTPSITPSVTPSVTPSGTPSPSTTGSALPTVPIIVMGFEISNLDNVGIYYSSSSATSHLRDAVVTGIRSKGASVYLTNVTLSNVMEVTDPLEKKTLFQDGRRRLSLGRGHARYLAATQTISVRAFIRMESFSQAQAVVYVLALNETELSGIVLTSLLGSDYDRYKSASVKVHELIAPYVYPRYIYPPPPDALLGLSVLEWVGVGIGCLIFLIGGLALGFFAGRRTAPPPIAPIAPKIVGRGRTRKYSVKGFKIKKSERNLINLNAPPLDDGLVENSDDEEEEHTGNEEAIVNSESTVAINTIDDISITTRKDEDNENQKEEEEEEEVQEDVQEVENPMVKARTRSRLAVVSVNLDTVKRSGIDVGEVISSRPIERIQFDFPVSMTTNPYHLLFLGEPNFIELVDREISRATALAAKALSAIEKVQNDILERRKTLARGGIAASVASNRLLDMVRSIEASLPSGRSDAGARRAEVAAINVAKNDKQLLEIRHSKYLELIEDLNRLKKQMSTEERKSRAERIPGLKSLLAFAPTTRQTNSGFQQNDDDDDDDIATKNTLQPLSVKTRMLAARGRKGRRGGRGGRRRGGDPASGAGASNEEAEDDAWDEDEDNHDEI